jgi:DUF4097 and DUF4098 domain-containing protein YvlB
MTPLALALLLFTAPGGAVPGVERRISLDLPEPRDRVVAIHSFGDLIVQPTAAGEKPRARLDLVASGGAEASARRYLEQVALEFDEGTTTIRSLFPPTEQKSPDVSIAATLTLWLPTDASVELRNAYGRVVVEGRVGDVRIANRMGAVEARRIGGSVDVEQQFAPVTAVDVGGDLVVRGKMVDVDARGIAGRVDVRTNGAGVRVDGAGSAYVETSLKPLVVQRVKGDATLHASFSDVVAKEIGGSLVVEGSNGTFVVEGVGRDLTLRTRFAPVRVNGVGGKAIVENSTRALELVNARGDVEASAHGGLLRVRWSRLPAAADGAAPRVTLESEAGGVEIEVPDGASASLDLTTTSGPIDCSIPGMTTTQSGATRSGALQLGEGKATIHATCVGGAIRVRRATAN